MSATTSATTGQPVRPPAGVSDVGAVARGALRRNDDGRATSPRAVVHNPCSRTSSCSRRCAWI